MSRNRHLRRKAGYTSTQLGKVRETMRVALLSKTLRPLAQVSR